MERYHIFKLGIAILFYAAYCVRPMVVNAQKLDDVATEKPKLDENEFVFYQGVQGKPGVDFPVLSHIPRTTFSCRDVDSGYYADLETDCQVFHICEENKKISFLCPNGTIFQQSELICEWWFKVNCTNSPSLYEESAEQLREENARRKSARRVQNHGAIMRMEERSSVSVVKNQENRRVYNNHASEYRDVDNNDLSRSSSSDFVRNGVNRPVPFQKKQEVEERKSGRGRKPVQFQKQPSVDNEKQKVRTSQRRNQQNGRKVSRKNQSTTEQPFQHVTVENERNNQNQRFSEKSRPFSTQFNNQPRHTTVEKNYQNRNQNSNNYVSTTERSRSEPTRFNSQPQYTTADKNGQNQNQNVNNYVSTTEKSLSEPTRFNNQPQYTTADKNNQNVNNYVSTTEKTRTSSTRFNNQLQHSTFETINYNSNQTVNDHFNTTENYSAFPTGFNSKVEYSTANNNYQQYQKNSFVDPEKSGSLSTQFNNQFQHSTAPNNDVSDQSYNFNNHASTTEKTFSTKFSSKVQHSPAERQNKNLVNQNNQYQNQGFNNYVTTQSKNQLQQSVENNDKISQNNFVTTSEKSRTFSTQFNNHQFNNQNQGSNNYISTTESTTFSIQPSNQVQQTTFQKNQFSDQNKASNYHVSTTESNAFSTQLNLQQSPVQNNGFSDHQKGSNFHASTTEKPAFSTQFNNQQKTDQNKNVYVSTTEKNQLLTDFNSQNAYLPTTQKTTFQPKDGTSTKNQFSLKFTEDFGTSTSRTNNTVEIIQEPDGTNNFVQFGTQKPVALRAPHQKPTKESTKITKSLEPNDSDEAQITQETSSFYKNSFNRIEENRKVTNPYPNHRTTYGEIKEPKYHSTKSFSTISSVTPQYLTTQAINSGKPFLGSQVGTTLRSTPVVPTTLLPPVKTGRGFSFSDSNPTKDLFNVGRTDKALPVTVPTTVAVKTPVVIPSVGSFNVGTTESTTRKIDHATVYGKFVSPSTEPSRKKTISLTKTLFASSSPKSEILAVADSYNRGPQVRVFGKVPTTKATTGFFVTKNPRRPQPFQLPPEPSLTTKPVYISSTPTVPTYRISSASPFVSLEPTQPTPFTTATPTLPSTFEDVDSMITVLAEMAGNFTEARPGLVIPPSAGPQTLHTLAVYFANALDGINVEEKETEGEEVDISKDSEKKKLTELLTQMTMDRYNELFSEEVTTTEEDLEPQHSKSPAQPEPKVRQLAKVFTQALSSYLDDPATFRKVLQEVRPTEPPTEAEDLDELLNFSDADTKSSFPPAPRPTWGYLLAINTTTDVRNSLQESENLQGADSQSFISQLNKLNRNEETTKLPENHWTSSPDVGKLWTKTFSFDPASINNNFGTTEATVFTTEEPEELEAIEEDHQVKYELRALPQLELNSTQVHGILIDFMNTTNNDNRLQRILRKLNTTQDEFLAKMKEIEGNPLTRRLILLLINECDNKQEVLQTASSNNYQKPKNTYNIVDPKLEDQDARALQLLNSLYTIASRFGK